MNKSHVCFFNDDVVLIQKYCAPLVMVVKVNTMIAVTQPSLTVDNQPFVALFKKFSTTEEAYEKWLYLVGKMCKKQENSKYFAKPKLEEHFNNGDKVEATDRAILVDSIRLIYEIVNQANINFKVL